MKNEEEMNKGLKKMAHYCKKYSDKLESVYLYFSYEEGTVFADFFMSFEGKIFEKNEIDKLLEIDLQTSIKKQQAFSEYLNKEYINLLRTAKAKDWDIPTEIKVIFDCKSDSISTTYSYGKKYSSSDKFVSDIYNEWIQTLKK